MPRITGKIFKIVPDGNYNKRLDDSFNILIRGAARAWLRAIITKIPIWTGFALGSVKFARGKNGFLAQYLNVAIPISTPQKYPKFYYHPSRVNRIRKIPENASKFGQYNFSAQRKIFQFFFRSDVVHFIINDFYGSRVTGPWHSMEFAQLAFEEYIKRNFARVINQAGSFTTFVEVPLGK
jgi:hypothetical protein